MPAYLTGTSGDAVILTQQYHWPAVSVVVPPGPTRQRATYGADRDCQPATFHCPEVGCAGGGTDRKAM